jgi:hypothetical protein
MGWQGAGAKMRFVETSVGWLGHRLTGDGRKGFNPVDIKDIGSA